MVRQIPLTKGQVALVDDDDFDRLSQFSWYAQPHRGTFYAQRTIYSDGKRRTIHMHHEVLGVQPYERIDHRNRNGLDNRKQNLRTATHSQNQWNRGPQANNASGFKGVYLDRCTGRWQAEIRFQRKRIHLGRFASPELAARAYDAKAIELHGQFAFVNFPNDWLGAGHE